MKEFEQAFEDAADDMIEIAGDESATYTNRDAFTVTLPVILSLDSQLQGDDLQTIVRADVIEFKTSTGYKPKRGETITTGGKTYTVESTYSRGSVWTKLIVK